MGKYIIFNPNGVDSMQYQDSTGREIKEGDLVRHRGAQYIIESFGLPVSGKPIKIHFKNTSITGDEWSVDLIKYRIPKK